jgi:DMSO reductase family type II enzyme chaperone
MTAEQAPPQIDDATLARSELYGLLADALDFPSREVHMRVEAGVLRDELAALIDALPYEIDVSTHLHALAAADDYVAFQGEYIRIFDVGAVRPPCPLYDGEWGGSRKHAMEEVLRFYRFFGMKMGDGTHDLPDHVSIELEFMRVLAVTEGMARANGGDTLPLLRAQRDFLQRHPGRWWPLLQRKLAAQEPPPFYAALASIVGAVFAADAAYLRDAIDRAPAAA